MEQSVLTHVGVKGMRWGERKEKETSQAQSFRERRDAKRYEKLKRTPLEKLSNENRERVIKTELNKHKAQKDAMMKSLARIKVSFGNANNVLVAKEFSTGRLNKSEDLQFRTNNNSIDYWETNAKKYGVKHSGLLTHYGVPGMKWGERKEKESKWRNVPNPSRRQRKKAEELYKRLPKELTKEDEVKRAAFLSEKLDVLSKKERTEKIKSMLDTLRTEKKEMDQLCREIESDPSSSKSDREDFARFARNRTISLETTESLAKKYGVKHSGLLTHVGVKGMRWGVRKEKETAASNSLSSMSDQDLHTRINRIRLENEYRTLTTPTTPPKKPSIIKKLLREHTENLGRQILNQMTGNAMDRLFKKKEGIDYGKQTEIKDITNVSTADIRKVSDRINALNDYERLRKPIEAMKNDLKKTESSEKKTENKASEKKTENKASEKKPDNVVYFRPSDKKKK